ncbi:MAG: bifunctional oligoribonuclease/PAP phosphatase NrnA [Treponema sp.]|jgi:phosphoesterase RecJ-like protein|nr:bifunctional oligoribonuclease/PAP phosphatase NrnA [Treponema sp.]
MKKHRETPVPAELIKFIGEGKRFIVAGHKEPDGDCVGSQLVMCSLLRRLGKEALPCSAGPFKRTEIKPFEGRFLPCPAEKDREGMRLIVMDCSNRERVGDLPLDGLPAASVDHHASGNPWGEAVYLDPRAPSVTFMTLKIMDAFSLVPSPEEAELLLFGLCTDTGFFRHVDETGAAVFEAAARLTAAGANPKRVHAAIHGGKSLESRLLIGKILSRTKAFYGGRLLVSYEEYEDSLRLGNESRDSDTIYQIMQAAAGVQAMVLIRQEGPANCTVGLRSLDRIDVASVAKQFGGGGHKNAAGVNTEGTIENVEERLVRAFAPFFT